ncbi:MAG: phosphoribosylformylglycinamidine synthase subunit PurS [Cryomorphaceae bacterium]|nr:phosphoribosylformylglycinamidine synthase subunit PurS [Cryomorphaceae bacterium]
MTFRADITIMPHRALLDPQGKAVTKSMGNIGLPGIENVRIGKHIQLDVNAETKEEAEKQVKTACDKLLANPIMEVCEFSISELETA